MDRTRKVIEFIEREYTTRRVIEPEQRHEKLKDRLFDVINTYNPGVIMKMGIGGGAVLAELARGAGGYLVVVEPSMETIRAFINDHPYDEVVKKIQFINGDYTSLPMDYYASDMVIVIDHFDLLETGRVMDEVKRVLQFDGILFFGGVVLQDDDIEGIYDDLMREAMPLHNDYYLVEDLKTFMDLKEFTFIKGSYEPVREDIESRIAFIKEYFGGFPGDPEKFLDEKKEIFQSLYKLEGSVYEEPYYAGVFMRRKMEFDAK